MPIDDDDQKVEHDDYKKLHSQHTPAIRKIQFIYHGCPQLMSTAHYNDDNEEPTLHKIWHAN